MHEILTKAKEEEKSMGSTNQVHCAKIPLRRGGRGCERKKSGEEKMLAIRMLLGKIQTGG